LKGGEVRFLLSFIICLLVVNPAFSQGGADDGTLDSISISEKSLTSTEALLKAIRYTGFGKKLTISKSLADEMSEKVIIEEDKTPFLNDQIEGKEVWKITFKNVLIEPKIKYPELEPISIIKDFEVFLDPKSGKLLKIFSKYEGDDPYMFPEPSAESATVALGSGGEVHFGFPDEPPQVSFIDAYLAAAGCAPFAAKEVIATYIMLKSLTVSLRPVWNITCRGIPPVIVSSMSEQSPVTRARCVVDANTGKWLFMTNSPHCPRPQDSVENE